MDLIAEVMLLVTAVTVVGTVQSQNSNGNIQNPPGNDQVMEQLYDRHIKPKIETMETTIRDMEVQIATQKNEIETLKNRKTMKCESGIVGQHTFPAPRWPYIQTVQFQSPFEENPTVTYGLFVLDSDNINNLRISTTVNAVTKTGFWVKFSTWAGTVLYGAKINWMACGK